MAPARIRTVLMLPEITVQLAGRVGSWHPRRVADAARTVWVTWLQAPRHGTIGVYVRAKPGAAFGLAETLLNGAWVLVRGLLRPLHVFAHGDDPRLFGNSELAPLLVHVVSVTRFRRRDPSPPVVDQSATLLVRSGRPIGAGLLSPAAHLADVYHLSAAGPSAGTLRRWSTLRGVVAEVGGCRYLRYVLAEEQA